MIEIADATTETSSRNAPMVEEQDKSYRLLFSHKKMVEDLIRHFLGGEWVERLDFATLEKASERDVSRDLLRREKDLLWRLRRRPEEGQNRGWFYVFCWRA